MASSMACPPYPPQKFQKPAPISGLTVVDVMCTHILVRQVKVRFRQRASTRGRIIEPNSCIEIIKTGANKQAMSIVLLKTLDRVIEFTRINAEPIARHINYVLL